MARHKLTREEQIRGLKKALASSKTPPQFREGIKKRLNRLGVPVYKGPGGRKYTVPE